MVNCFGHMLPSEWSGTKLKDTSILFGHSSTSVVILLVIMAAVWSTYEWYTLYT
jgi:hypothetical protein